MNLCVFYFGSATLILNHMYGAVLVPDQTQKHDSFKITIGREKVIIVRAGTYT